MIILQIATGGEIDTTAVAGGTEPLRVLDLLLKGGFVMIPLLILLFITVYIFVERILTIQKAARVPEQFTEKIRRLVTTGDISGARLICSQTNTPIARMIEKGNLTHRNAPQSDRRCHRKRRQTGAISARKEPDTTSDYLRCCPHDRVPGHCYRNDSGFYCDCAGGRKREP